MTTETGMYMLVCISGVVGLVYHGGVLSSRMRKLARVMYKVGSARRYRYVNVSTMHIRTIHHYASSLYWFLLSSHV